LYIFEYADGGDLFHYTYGIRSVTNSMKGIEVCRLDWRSTTLK